MKFLDSRAREKGVTSGKVEEGTRWETSRCLRVALRVTGQKKHRGRVHTKGVRVEHLVAVTLTALPNIVPRQSSALKHFNRQRGDSARAHTPWNAARRETTSDDRARPSEYFRNLWRMLRMQLVLLSQKIKAKIEQRRGGARFASIGPFPPLFF